MKAISDNLIHFLGREYKDSPYRQLEVFKEIIEKGLRLSNIETVFGATGLVLNQGVCFTDIPLNFCDEQTAVYGKFGIAHRFSWHLSFPHILHIPQDRMHKPPFLGQNVYEVLTRTGGCQRGPAGSRAIVTRWPGTPFCQHSGVQRLAGARAHNS